MSFYPDGRDSNYDDTTISENARVQFPTRYLKNAAHPAVGDHPKNIIFLVNDPFGVMPPVSKLTQSQALYHYLSGYSPSVVQTKGIDEAAINFSACFGESWLTFHPSKYIYLF